MCGAQGTNYDDGKRMVECVSCFIWMHTACYGIADDSDPPVNMLCSDCVAKNDKIVNEAARDPVLTEWFVNCVCGAQVRNFKSKSFVS